MIRTLVVDPYTLVRTGLKKLLSEAPGMAVVGEAERGEAAIAAARDLEPDVVVLNIDLPGMDGLETTRRMQRLAAPPNVVALGAHRDGLFPSRLLEVGAAAYLTKDCGQEELLGAVRQAARGQRYVSVDVAQNLVLGKLDPDGDPLGRLTARELSVMVLVSQGHSRHEISDKLSVSPKTVSTYRTRLMRKLGARSDVQLTHLSLRHGLIAR